MKLEIGSVIYGRDINDVVYLKRCISRVTAKQAIYETDDKNKRFELRFDRDVQDGKWFTEIGATGWNNVHWHEASPELEAEYIHTSLVNSIRSIRLESLSSGQLLRMLDISKEAKVQHG